MNFYSMCAQNPQDLNGFSHIRDTVTENGKHTV